MINFLLHLSHCYRIIGIAFILAVIWRYFATIGVDTQYFAIGTGMWIISEVTVNICRFTKNRKGDE